MESLIHHTIVIKVDAQIKEVSSTNWRTSSEKFLDGIMVLYLNPYHHKYILVATECKLLQEDHFHYLENTKKYS